MSSKNPEKMVYSEAPRGIPHEKAFGFSFKKAASKTISLIKISVISPKIIRPSIDKVNRLGFKTVRLRNAKPTAKKIKAIKKSFNNKWCFFEIKLIFRTV